MFVRHHNRGAVVEDRSRGILGWRARHKHLSGAIRVLGVTVLVQRINNLKVCPLVRTLVFKFWSAVVGLSLPNPLAEWSEATVA